MKEFIYFLLILLHEMSEMELEHIYGDGKSLDTTLQKSL